MKNKDILISIHDVMPSNINKIETILKTLQKNHNINYVTLLIVPGLKWTELQLNQLKNLSKQGHELAGHGWIHKVSEIKTIYHKLHSLILSRDVAEHLSLSKKDCINLVENCFNWFDKNFLPTPQLYVPPSWAIGKLNKKDFNNSNFSMFETLKGIYFNNNFLSLPLLGYEVDTTLRKIAVLFSNFLNKKISTIFKKPIRLSIHPNDLELLLAKNLLKDLNSKSTFWSYENYFKSKKLLK